MDDQAGQQDQEPGQAETPEEITVDVNELAVRMEKLESYNSKLLEETKQWRGKFKNLRTEVDGRETQAMQDKNDFKGLYEKNQEELAGLRQEIKKEKITNLESDFRLMAARHAPDAEDPELLVAVLNRKKGSVAYDHDNKQWE